MVKMYLSMDDLCLGDLYAYQFQRAEASSWL